LRIALRTAALVAAISLALGAALPGVEAEIVVVVSTKSAVTALTRDQVADLFLGKQNRFPGGTKAAPLDLPEGSPDRDAFYAQFAGKSPAQVKAHWSKIIFTGRGQPPPEVPDGKAARQRVAGDPAAVAYIQRSLADDSVRIVAE
jgi:ABC-type phosphate transport system substrate-binding protein